MPRINHLLLKIEQAKDILESVEAERDEFLQPILVVLGATGGGIDHVLISGEFLHVTRIGSSRGCSWRDDHKFPISIFTAIDPITEAKKYVDCEKELKLKSERQNKLKQIQQLQNELGETS